MRSERGKPSTQIQRTLIQAALLPTWQTAAAVAQHAGVPTRTAYAVLQKYANVWNLECRSVRIDGHNAVSMFRKRVLVRVMGVSIPQDVQESEL